MGTATLRQRWFDVDSFRWYNVRVTVIMKVDSTFSGQPWQNVDVLTVKQRWKPNVNIPLHFQRLYDVELITISGLIQRWIPDVYITFFQPINVYIMAILKADSTFNIEMYT